MLMVTPKYSWGYMLQYPLVYGLGYEEQWPWNAYPRPEGYPMMVDVNQDTGTASWSQINKAFGAEYDAGSEPFSLGEKYFSCD